jgi:hypothetical protein
MTDLGGGFRRSCLLRIVRCVFCIAAVLAFSGTASAAANAEIIDRVLAVVGTAVITQSDATAAFELGIVSFDPGDDPMANVLSKLIDRQLVLLEVERYAPPDPPAAAVDRLLESVRAKFATSELYAAALSRSGVDEPRLRQLLRDQLRIETYFNQRFPSERRDVLISEWVAGLRRRTDITYLNLTRR